MQIEYNVFYCRKVKKWVAAKNGKVLFDKSKKKLISKVVRFEATRKSRMKVHKISLKLNSKSEKVFLIEKKIKDLSRLKLIFFEVKFKISYQKKWVFLKNIFNYFSSK